MKKRRIILIASIAAYTLLMLFGGCADKLILFPSTGPLNPHNAKQLLIPNTTGGHVECWVDRSTIAAPQAILIEFTGNATRAEQIASFAALRWASHPVEVYAVNYPGYGQSTGPAKLAAIAPAALLVYDHVAKHNPGKPIFIAGNSLGTTAALYLASQRPCAGLILQNPPAIRNLILTQFGWWNLWLLAGPVALQIPSDLDGPTLAAKVNVPAIFLLAQDDDFVVPANQRKVVDAYVGAKRIINTTGGHNSSIDSLAEHQLHQEINWLWDGAVAKPMP